MIDKHLYLQKKDVEKWERFCEDKFKTKRVLSKIVTEAMEEYIKNY